LARRDGSTARMCSAFLTPDKRSPADARSIGNSEPSEPSENSAEAVSTVGEDAALDGHCRCSASHPAATGNNGRCQGTANRTAGDTLEGVLSDATFFPESAFFAIPLHSQATPPYPYPLPLVRRDRQLRSGGGSITYRGRESKGGTTIPPPVPTRRWLPIRRRRPDAFSVVGIGRTDARCCCEHAPLL